MWSAETEARHPPRARLGYSYQRVWRALGENAGTIEDRGEVLLELLASAESECGRRRAIRATLWARTPQVESALWSILDGSWMLDCESRRIAADRLWISRSDDAIPRIIDIAWEQRGEEECPLTLAWFLVRRSETGGNRLSVPDDPRVLLMGIECIDDLEARVESSRVQPYLGYQLASELAGYVRRTQGAVLSDPWIEANRERIETEAYARAAERTGEIAAARAYIEGRRGRAGLAILASDDLDPADRISTESIVEESLGVHDLRHVFDLLDRDAVAEVLEIRPPRMRPSTRAEALAEGAERTLDSARVGRPRAPSCGARPVVRDARSAIPEAQTEFGLSLALFAARSARWTPELSDAHRMILNAEIEARPFLGRFAIETMILRDGPSVYDELVDVAWRERLVPRSWILTTLVIESFDELSTGRPPSLDPRALTLAVDRYKHFLKRGDGFRACEVGAAMLGYLNRFQRSDLHQIETDRGTDRNPARDWIREVRSKTDKWVEDNAARVEAEALAYERRQPSPPF